jgi:hypothetical protein
MELRTTFTIDPSREKISYNTPVMLIGSCFASEIGSKMGEGRMKVLVNPAGTVYNPVSVGITIDTLLENKICGLKDLYNYRGINLSFLHYTSFSSGNASKVIEKINSATAQASIFLKNSGFLIITFGTARIYRFNETGEVVSNCHKLPSSLFSREILTVDQIVSEWEGILDRLKLFNPDIRVIFTISPVRHWKDGPHGNQISKSILFLAVEKLLKHKIVNGYFPAYELLMDDLRDYRYYADDMLHPSQTAVDYIWKAFSECYFDPTTLDLWKEVQGISRARNHRFISDSKSARSEFAKNILKKISQIGNRNSQIDLNEEKKYFMDLTREEEPI